MDELTAANGPLVRLREQAEAAKIGKEFGMAMQRAADAMTHFAKVWRASEAADELRRIGYSVPMP